MTSWDYKEWTQRLVAIAATEPGEQKLKGTIEEGKGRGRKGKKRKGRVRKGQLRGRKG